MSAPLVLKFKRNSVSETESNEPCKKMKKSSSREIPWWSDPKMEEMLCASIQSHYAYTSKRGSGNIVDESKNSEFTRLDIASFGIDESTN